MELTVAHEFLPKQRSTRAAIVMDQFGIDFEQGRHVIAESLSIPIAAGDVVLFTGESGSGKSSLLRALSQSLREELGDGGVIDVATIPAGEQLLIDRLPGSEVEAMHALSMCGLSEAHLMLRTPQELSDGQRYRFQLALGVSSGAPWLLADEFTATLDRTLAKLIAFNVRRLADRTAQGILLATTHEDVVEDLSPDVHVHCRLGGEIDVVRTASDDADGSKKKRARELSFAGDIWISEATRGDWPYFARWHYRSHNLGPTKFMTLLWHGEEPIGICVFVAPPVSLGPRNRLFGRSGNWNRLSMQAMNRQLAMLSRVVLHPAYRGAGLAARFIRRSCELSGIPWIETLAAMGRVNPVFKKAGFVRVGPTRATKKSREGHSTLYGRPAGARPIRPETYEKSRRAAPVYYIFDNREAAMRSRSGREADES